MHISYTLSPYTIDKKSIKKGYIMNYFSHRWGIGFGWLVPIFIIGLIIYLFQNKTEEKSTKSSAQEILDKRYANGGISKQEYEEKSKAIREQGTEG